MPDQMTVEQFGATIKSKYPAYASKSDLEVGNAMLAKYPQYASRVKASPVGNTGVSIGARPPLFSKAGMKELGWGTLFRTTESLPAIGGTIGGVAGTGLGLELGPGDIAAGTAGATAGGIAGKAAQEAIVKKMGWGETPKTAGQELKSLAKEGAIQGVSELAGLGLAKGGGALLRTSKLAAPPLVIAGETMPRTTGQVAGAPGGLSQTLEHYLSGTWMSPLRKVRVAQQQATQKILSNLSHASDAAPETLVRNWEAGAEETRALADPLYDSLRPVVSTQGGQVAKDILANDTLRLGTAAKKALVVASGTGDTEEMRLANQVAKGQGYKDFPDLMQRQPDLAKRLLPTDVYEGAVKGQPTTVGDLINARSSIGKLAKATKDPAERVSLWEAADQLNAAIDADLKNPEQKAAKVEADTLWRRSRIMDKVSDSLQDAARRQDPKLPAKLDVDAFVTMVNDLSHQRLHRETVDGVTRIIAKPSELDALFSNPSDRKAMVDLASFLKTQHRSLAGTGGAGLSEQIARLSAAMAVPTLIGGAIYGAATGNERTEEGAGAGLAGLYAMSLVLAHPGGAQLIAQFLQGGARYGTPAMMRIVDIARHDTGVPPEPSPLGPKTQSMKKTAAQSRYPNGVAEHDQTGHIVGHDGQQWVDAETGEPVAQQ